MKSQRMKTITFLVFFVNFFCFAQFYTVNKRAYTTTKVTPKVSQSTETQLDTNFIIRDIPTKITAADTILPTHPRKSTTHKRHGYKSPQIPVDSSLLSLPLNFPNLIKALISYKVKHPRIVLAQAIQETGWLRSSVCRTKNNLFGLTNPYTGEYYVFNHWSESVRGYITLVQYKYHGGNYFRWLDDIGYAGDPNYTSSLRKIIRQHL